jgi:hypothetical protein
MNTGTKEENGRYLWKSLHTRAYNHDGKDDSLFIKNFSQSVPQYMTGCKCSEHWNRWIANNKPRHFDKDRYFTWTVFAHNAVNFKLGKKQLSIEEATAYVKSCI